MDNKDLTKGTRIYFNGDMANEEGLGVITRQITDRFGTVVDIRMDDKRFFPSISVTAFSDKYLGHGGTRFVTEEAYRDFRQDQINKVEATLAQKDAERSEKKKPVTDDELDAMLVEASEEAEKRGEPDEIDDALVPKYAIQPLRTAVLVRFASGEIDVAELARKELESRGVDVESPPARVKKEGVELRCKACHNWRHESTWARIDDKHGCALRCPNCLVRNTGDIDSRPVERSKSVSIQSFFKGGQ